MDQKELKKLIKLCQKEGISEIRYQGVEITFGQKPRRTRAKTQESFEEPEIQYTDEEILNWSSQGIS